MVIRKENTFVVQKTKYERNQDKVRNISKKRVESTRKVYYRRGWGRGGGLMSVIMYLLI
jgi:hypothetical protein